MRIGRAPAPRHGARRSHQARFVVKVVLERAGTRDEPYLNCTPRRPYSAEFHIGAGAVGREQSCCDIAAPPSDGARPSLSRRGYPGHSHSIVPGGLLVTS